MTLLLDLSKSMYQKKYIKLIYCRIKVVVKLFQVIKDLHRRLDTALPFQPPLEGVNQHYGMNTNLLKTIVEYWRHKYNWTERQAFFNQFPQFKTKIQVETCCKGFDSHYKQ